MSENLIDEVNAISIKSHETNALQTWNYEDKQIRTIKMDDEMWFVAKDVATVLNYSNPRDAVSRHVDEEDKGVVKHDTFGGVQNLAIINESGVYALIFGSKLPTAKNVKKWFGEMLATVKPSERKEEFAMNENLIDEIESQKIEDYSEKADASKNSLQLWNYEDNNVRTIEMDGEMWFVAKDVAQILGYAKPRNAIIAHVDEEDKKDAPIQGDLGGTQMMTIINESGVYALIFGSKLPNAKKFKRWVTSVVLPSVRKHGAYIQGQETLSKKDLETVYQKMDELMKLQTGDSVSKEKVARMEHKTRLKEIELEMKKTEMQAELQKQQLEMEMKKRELELAVEKMNIQQKMISNLSSMYCLTPEQRETLIALAKFSCDFIDESDEKPNAETATISVLAENEQLQGKLFTATEIGKILHITPHKVGMIANQQKLKTKEYGIYRMTKDSNGIERQVFNYNEMALEKFREIVQEPPTLSTEVNWI